jgi:tetraacyldisaccharide-1-P 4'-kinase
MTVYFWSTLSVTVSYAQRIAFRDHQRLRQADALRLLELARRQLATLVTTEKDLSRIEATAGASLAGGPLLVMRIEAMVWDAQLLLGLVRRTIQ